MRIYTRPSSRIDLIARASQSVRASTMLRPLAPRQAARGQRPRALSRQMSIGHFRAQNLSRAVTIHEQKQWSSTVSRRPGIPDSISSAFPGKGPFTGTSL
jgi:hypothetical protein